MVIINMKYVDLGLLLNHELNYVIGGEKQKIERQNIFSILFGHAFHKKDKR